MPPRWVHESFDIVAFGKSYWPIHRQKDAAWEDLGPQHRIVNHEWYPLFRAVGMQAPFPESVHERTRQIRESEGPDRAEEFQVRVSHDSLDAWWDELSTEDRLRVAMILRGVMLDVPLLQDWAGVDVLQGLIKRRYDQEYGYAEPIERWEPESSLPADYRNLRSFLESRTIRELLYMPE